MKYVSVLLATALLPLMIGCKSDIEEKTAAPVEPVNPFSTTTHLSASSNISANTSRIDDSGLHNKPDVFAFLTPNWSVGSVYNISATGIFYSSGGWRLFNQDLKAFPAGMGYNVLIVQPHANVFKHVATVANTATFPYVTALDHPKLNGNPNARLLVQQRWSSTYNDSPVGLYYRPTSNRWEVFNQKIGTPIKVGAEFNVLINDNISTTVAASGKITGNNFLIDPPIIGPAKRVFVSQYWTGVYNTQEVGVWNPSTWSIFNQNSGVTMPTNARFFVFAP